MKEVYNLKELGGALLKASEVSVFKDDYVISRHLDKLLDSISIHSKSELMVKWTNNHESQV